MTKNFKIGSAVSLGIAGLVAFLIVWIYSLKTDKASLEWELAAKDAEDLVIKPIAEYSEPDTIWDSIPAPYAIYDTIPGKPDTLWKKVPWAKLYGSVKFDTTIKLGPKSNPLSIRTEVEIWYPKEFSYRNRFKLYPVDGETPYRPLSARSRPKWGLGLSYTRSFSVSSDRHGMDYMGISGRYQRFSLTSAYDPWHKTALMTVGFDIWGF